MLFEYYVTGSISAVKRLLRRQSCWITLCSTETYIILQIHFNSQVKQELHDVGVTSRTSPVQSGSTVLQSNRWGFKKKWKLTIFICQIIKSSLPGPFCRQAFCQTEWTALVSQTAPCKQSYRSPRLTRSPPLSNVVTRLRFVCHLALSSVLSNVIVRRYFASDLNDWSNDSGNYENYFRIGHFCFSN